MVEVENQNEDVNHKAGYEAGILRLDHNFYDHIFFFRIFLKKAYILNVFRQFTKKDDMIVKIMIKL